ncbi:MAG: type pilus assembly protein PilB [Solirubrobacteraceae bacterium]|jgi:type IV pilus assembly protein PilB|nr:type pilus assembly protein PilB [Solirubrobacteraceae bacterium]MEA2394370.1 type pilus assembly protein PilB [Solirubrobacteraceae bacterium]
MSLAHSVPSADQPHGLTHPSQRGRSSRFIGDIIVDLGYANRESVEAGIAESRASGRRTGEVLVERGVLTADQLARVVAERFGVDHLDLGVFKVDMTAANVLPSSAAKRYGAVPVRFMDKHTLLVAMVDPGNVLAIDDISLMTGYDVRPAVAPEEDISALIQRLNSLDDMVVEEIVDQETGGEEIVDLRESAADAPVIKLVHSLIAQGVEQGASDIHFEPINHELGVRYRIDGVLIEATTIPRQLVAAVISRIKIMSELDIAERRVPQDGRVALTIDGRSIDIRVATLPLVGGESAVLRVLDKEGAVSDLDRLGMADQERDLFVKAFSRPHGAVLVTGPTGSGKTTTLYGALHRLHTPEKNIITIEDPVEYELSGVKQMQVNVKAGLQFSTGLRSMMRADPDIIMVGEIRDRETAQIAVEAALTGHLVLSTLHTNDAPGAIARLIEMGVEPFLVASAVDCVVAQRLARRLCEHCRRPVRVDGSVARENGYDVDDEALDVFEAVGCTRCGGSGYKGRIGLYEVMPVSEEIRKLAVGRASADAISEAAKRAGMRSLRDEGLVKVRDGLTSFAELSRVTG